MCVIKRVTPRSAEKVKPQSQDHYTLQPADDLMIYHLSFMIDADVSLHKHQEKEGREEEITGD